MVVLDTSIVIDHLRRPSLPSIFSRLPTMYPDQTFSISIISVQELFTGKSTRRDKEKEALLIILGNLKILPYTHEIARAAGQIQRDVKPNIGFADAAIAATSIANGASLATINKRDFAGIAGLELINVHAGAWTAPTQKEKQH